LADWAATAGTFFTTLAGLPDTVCVSSGVNESTWEVALYVGAFFAAIAAVVFSILVRPGGYMVLSAGCWCLGTVLAARACSKLHVHLFLVLVMQ
jgi:hypothetical protein